MNYLVGAKPTDTEVITDEKEIEEFMNEINIK